MLVSVFPNVMEQTHSIPKSIEPIGTVLPVKRLFVRETIFAACVILKETEIDSANEPAALADLSA